MTSKVLGVGVMAVKHVTPSSGQSWMVRSCTAALAATLLVSQTEGCVASEVDMIVHVPTNLASQIVGVLTIWATLVGLLVLFTLGVCAGWYAHGWTCTTTTTTTTTMRSISCQAPVTYLRNRVTPRFHPLPEDSHGAFL
jgi:hypothetical protein